jgi:hypothetical protein
MLPELIQQERFGCPAQLAAAGTPTVGGHVAAADEDKAFDGALVKDHRGFQREASSASAPMAGDRGDLSPVPDVAARTKPNETGVAAIDAHVRSLGFLAVAAGPYGPDVIMTPLARLVAWTEAQHWQGLHLVRPSG